MNSQNTPPNLFAFATKELSQDGFIAWLIQWADPRNKAFNPALFDAATHFVLQLTSLQGISPTNITDVKVYRQWNHIDVCAEINHTHFIIIEDKVGTGKHSDQLKRYKTISEEKCKEENRALTCIYLKTQSESKEISDQVSAEGFVVFTRKEFLSLLKEHKVDNNIYNDFTAYLQKIEDSESQFKNKNPSDWNAPDCKGFYRALEEKNVVMKWDYANNRSGGIFYASLGGGPAFEHYCYVQLEYELERHRINLYFKIVVEKGDKNAIRDQAHHLLMSNRQTDLPILKPYRLRKGTYMTLALTPLDTWLIIKEGKLDFEATTQRLISYKSWLSRTIENHSKTPLANPNEVTI